MLHVPIPEGEVADRLAIDLLWTGPLGATIEIVYNDHSLFNGFVPSGEWQRTFDLPADVPRPAMKPRSVSNRPRSSRQRSWKDPTDQRTLGIMVRGLRLLSADP